MTIRPLLALMILAAASPAMAAGAGPDLAVSLTPPAAARVYQTAGYNMQVRNLGNKDAAGVRLTIQLPTTRTSPQVYVMGTLGAYSLPCTRTGTTLVCQLGTIRKASASPNSASIFFDIALPYSTLPIVFSAAATTTSRPGDTNPANNNVSYTASPLTYSLTVSTGATATNSHCTGSTQLSSYFECTLFPSSISSHQTIFNADNTITIVGEPSYTGTWTYTPATNRLQFDYDDGTGVVATFDGRGTTANGKCAEGKTTFTNNPSYISMYRVCFP
jgi:hypothetical protein